MSEFPESAFQDGREEAGFLSRLGLAVLLVMAGVGVAVFMAAG